MVWEGTAEPSCLTGRSGSAALGLERSHVPWGILVIRTEQRSLLIPIKGCCWETPTPSFVGSSEGVLDPESRHEVDAPLSQRAEARATQRTVTLGGSQSARVHVGGSPRNIHISPLPSPAPRPGPHSSEVSFTP